MRLLLARILAFLAFVAGAVSIPVKWSGDAFLGAWGGGWLKAAAVALLLAIYLVLDDLRERYQKAHM